MAALALSVGVAACGGSLRSQTTTSSDSQQAEAGAGEQRRLLEVADSCADRHVVGDEDLVVVAEWAAAMADGYAVWAPGDSQRFSVAFEKLAICAANRGLDGRLSKQAKSRMHEGAELGFSEPTDSLGEDTQRVRTLGDANRCMTFLAGGLLSDERSPSCGRLNDGAAHEGAVAADATSSESVAGIPESLVSPAAIEGAALLHEIAQLLTAPPAGEVERLRFPALAKALRARTVERLDSLRVRLPLTSEYLADVPSRQLPSSLSSVGGGVSFEQSSIDSIIYFEVGRTYLVAWPSMAYERQSGDVSIAGAPGMPSEPVELRAAHARSVSPQRLSAAQVRERRESAEQAAARSGLVQSTEPRALVLSHRLGVWAALRPGLCAAHELGVRQFEFAAEVVGEERSLVVVPMFVRVVHPDLPDAGARVAEVEAREDGFLVTLTNGDAQAFPFVDGDAYLKVYAYLREHSVSEVAVKSEPRVELQIIATLAEAIAWDRGAADTFSADRALLRAPVEGDVPTVRVGLRLRCSPVTE